MQISKLNLTKIFKPVLSAFAIVSVVASGFYFTQKNHLAVNPYKNNAEALPCNNSFSDNFTSSTNTVNPINATVNGEYYTTDGTKGNLAEIVPGSAGVRIRNFVDSMGPWRHGGLDFSDQWGS
jgi:hypothetical protein